MQPSPPRRFTFLAKLIGAAALIGAADRLLYAGSPPGATLGVFALGWTAVLAILRTDVRRDRAARCALIAAGAFGIALVDDPGLLVWVLFWVAIASATLLPRRRFDDAIVWGLRLIVHALLGVATPFRDAVRFASARRRRDRADARAILSLLALPVLGGGVFVALFASANPLIEKTVAALRLPDLSSGIGHLVFWCALLLAIWPNLRPRSTILRPDPARFGGARRPPDVPLATLTLSLLTFNAIFAVQNALDLAFLWSGAPLPRGVTMTEYVHRGAYPLIVTALLAGAFVLIAARPGSAGETDRSVRRLIVLWVAQNVLLVASSILRTLDYIATSMLTTWRIAALAWMALVATGLLLIVWRMLSGRSTRWLVNANALAAAVVLAAASVSDFGAIAAAWNVRHAREAGDLDLCYLEALGPSALLPLIELEARATGPILRDRAGYLRAQALRSLAGDQADLHRWTWLGARRLAAARTRLGSPPRTLRAVSEARECGGIPYPSSTDPIPQPGTRPEPIRTPPPPAPLTKAPGA